MEADLTLPVLDLLPDGCCSSVLISPKIRGKARAALIEAARGGQDLDEDQARYVRVIEYEVPDRDGDGTGEVIALVTTITQMTAAPAPLLAQAYHQRWEHETGNARLKTCLRGPGRVLRSRSPDMGRQEIYGYLLTYWAISALICRAATEADIDPDRVKFKWTVRIVRSRAADPAAWSYPGVVKRGRHNSFRVKRPGDHGTRYPGPATIKLVKLRRSHSRHDRGCRAVPDGFRGVLF